MEIAGKGLDPSAGPGGGHGVPGPDMSGPYSHSGREDALFFQLLLDLRQVLFDKHKAQAHQQ